MSWLFSQALVEEFSAASCSDGELSVRLKSKTTPQVYLSPDRMTDASPRFLSGMTCEPLTVDRGEDALTSFLAAFPVKTSLMRERAPGLTVPEAGSGWKWPGSLAKYNPASSSWKTRQCLLLGGLDAYLEIWPRWGLMRSGEFWEQLMPGRIMSENGSGWWPTPTCTVICETTERWQKRKENFRNGLSNFDPGLKLEVAIGGYPNPTWVEWLMGWPEEWTKLESRPLATDKFQWWLRSHGEHLEGLD